MNELDKINLEYTAKRLAIEGDKKFLELQKEIAKAQANMIEYLKLKIPEELKENEDGAA